MAWDDEEDIKSSVSLRSIVLVGAISILLLGLGIFYVKSREVSEKTNESEAVTVAVPEEFSIDMVSSVKSEEQIAKENGVGSDLDALDAEGWEKLYLDERTKVNYAPMPVFDKGEEVSNGVYYLGYLDFSTLSPLREAGIKTFSATTPLMRKEMFGIDSESLIVAYKDGQILELDELLTGSIIDFWNGE